VQVLLVCTLTVASNPGWSLVACVLLLKHLEADIKRSVGTLPVGLRHAAG
jgi:hypothetical protein